MQERIMSYDQSFLLAPDGSLLWQGAHAERNTILKLHAADLGRAYNALAAICGEDTRQDGRPWVSTTDVRDVAESLGFISRHGCAPGFFNHLPPATYLERVVQSFNHQYFAEIRAHEIEFPSVFDNRPADIADLTESYESQGRMFRLEDRDKGLRLAYAADPGLFSWLRGQSLLAERLPYAIVSQTLAMRRHPSGELGPYNRARQYKLPDVHILTHAPEASESLLQLVEQNSKAADFWSHGHFIQFLDATQEFLDHNPDIPAQMAQKAGTFTLVNRLAKQPRYYAMRSGMMVDAGTNAIMLFNIQWDEENAERFRIRLNNKGRLIVLHANALASSGLLNTIIGRALAQVTPKRLPPEIMIAPVTLVPLREEFKAAAYEHASRLGAQGLRSHIQPMKKSIGATLWNLRQLWLPAVAVIGEREAKADHLVFEQGFEATKISESAFKDTYMGRISRCQGGYSSPDDALPFFVSPPQRPTHNGGNASGSNIAPNEGNRL